MIASHYLLLRRTKPTHLAQGGSFSLEAVLPAGRRDSIGLNCCPAVPCLALRRPSQNPATRGFVENASSCRCFSYVRNVEAEGSSPFTSTRVPFELGHGEDPVEGRPVLLMAEPAAFHFQTFEDRRVEQLAGPVAGFAVGVAAAGGERRR